MRTLILSDIHLGTHNCRAEQVLEALTRMPFDRLILNGDTINSVNLRKLTPRHWEVVNQLRQIGRSREVILVRGNHDYEPSPRRNANGNGNGHAFNTEHVLPTLLGVRMVEDYRLDLGSAAYLVLHGDRFDPTVKVPMLLDVADWCYQASQKISKKLARWLKKKSKRWGGFLDCVRRKSAAFAREQGCAGVVIGHTHYADDVRVDDIHYLNTGSWTESPCTYAVAEDGRIRLHQFAE
jgi:UDP-2,3-diacylglucosamine pyrophosphatase LpxH